MAGFSTTSVIAGASTNANLVKPAPGQINGWYLKNNAAYDVWLKLYDSATIPTAGAGTPKLRIGIPAGAGANVQFGSDPQEGIGFASGIGFTITKLVADNDTTVLVASDLVVNLFWK